ncbi:MAG: hypothetical protein AB8B99_23035 [Phormidesmis sp.]
MVTFNVNLFQVSAQQFVEATLTELAQNHVDDEDGSPLAYLEYPPLRKSRS